MGISRDKSVAIAVQSFLVVLLALCMDESCAFYTPSASATEKIYSGHKVVSNGNVSRRIKPKSRLHLYPSFDGGMEMGGEQEPQRQPRPRPTMDPITETSFDFLGPRSITAKPKIVVLGATGRIGRNVIRQLMQTKCDMEIVAFVRSYDKAIRVLYDDQVFVSGGGNAGSNRKNGRPTLQIIQGDLVPPEELPGFVQDNTEDENEWKETANSASDFYGTKVKDYDNRELLPDVNESLEDAIRDCTTIISCVGSVRRTHLWHDVLARPLVRLLKADVSSWCKDGRHPFYVNYASTRKALGFAERDQIRREAAATTVAEAEGLDLNEIYVPRIRFIRISDLCVGYKPWGIVPMVANAFHSLTFRYQEMAEQLLEESSLVETVTLRPGDLVDEERDVNVTSIQVSCNGKVQSPALIGREDVATLAVAAATFATQNSTESNNQKSDSRTTEPFHYTFGCRWVGQTLDSYPPQGNKLDGHPDAAVSFRRSLNVLYNSERERKRRKERSHTGSSTDMIVRMAQQVGRQKRRKTKPYGIFVAIPLYLTLVLLGKVFLAKLIPHIPGGNEWILPNLNRARNMLALGFAYLYRRMLLLLPWLVRRSKPNYIRF